MGGLGDEVGPLVEGLWRGRRGVRRWRLDLDVGDGDGFGVWLCWIVAGYEDFAGLGFSRCSVGQGLFQAVEGLDWRASEDEGLAVNWRAVWTDLATVHLQGVGSSRFWSGLAVGRVPQSAKLDFWRVIGFLS